MVAVINPLAMVAGTDSVERPDTQVTNDPSGRSPSMEKVKVMPGAAGMPWVAVRAGNAITGRAPLVAGHDLMNVAASV